MATLKALVVGGWGWGAWWGTNVWTWGWGAWWYRYNAIFTVTPQAYSITVWTEGLWWTTSNTAGTNWWNSTFSTITSTGWGAGAIWWWNNGWSWWGNTGNAWVSWAVWLWTSGEGNNGGVWNGSVGWGFCSGGGWGGSGWVWWTSPSSGTWWSAGIWTSNSISSSAVTYASGWVWWGDSTGGWGTAGSNTGNWWWGWGWSGIAWLNGGSGVVIISYATNGSDGVSPTSTGGIITTSGWQTIHTFTTSGTFTMIAPSTSSANFLFLFAYV